MHRRTLMQWRLQLRKTNSLLAETSLLLVWIKQRSSTSHVHHLCALYNLGSWLEQMWSGLMSRPNQEPKSSSRDHCLIICLEVEIIIMAVVSGFQILGFQEASDCGELWESNVSWTSYDHTRLPLFGALFRNLSRCSKRALKLTCVN